MFAAAFQVGPVASAIVTVGDGHVLFANDAFLALTGHGRDGVIGHALGTLSLLAGPDPSERLAELLAESGHVPRLQARLVTAAGAVLDTIIEASLLPVDGPACLLLTFHDLTEQRRAEQALRQSEERYQLTAHATADAVYEWDIQSGTTRWNHGMRTLFGYPVDDRQAHMWWREQVHPEDRQRTVASVENAIARRNRFWECEYRYRRANGSYAHVVDRGYVLYDEAGQPLRMLGAMIDITERVEMAEAQARAALEERHRLARELHDSVTQSLYSLTLLAEAGRRLAEQGNLERVTQYVGRLGETAQQALKEMRLLVYQLRPLALESEGLAGALQHRLDAVEKRAGIQTQLFVVGMLDLPPAVEADLFRIAQEALNNALKHSQASSVTVRLCLGSGRVGLEVADNGRGFAPQGPSARGGWGLTSMRERVEARGGSLQIEATPGQGTRVLVVVAYGEPTD
jgi:PAS domain S-box-containing protein